MTVKGIAILVPRARRFLVTSQIKPSGSGEENEAEQDANFVHFYDACSVANNPKGVLGTRVNPDRCRMSVGYV